ncbi:hypothetical protein [Paraburkholderia mimosarum]|uniref:hypothetical protein n=1 Tax=Paraburkholderia mimosarum TaxID=312026 RepID=UPI001427B312|nr:hypothetical protein [Paraburkholderia mimosarum]
MQGKAYRRVERILETFALPDLPCDVDKVANHATSLLSPVTVARQSSGDQRIQAPARKAPLMQACAACFEKKLMNQDACAEWPAPAKRRDALRAIIAGIKSHGRVDKNEIVRDAAHF